MQYTQEQLTEMLEKHRKWLRGENDGSRAVLTGAVLTDAVLAGAVLTDAVLAGAVLLRADLTDAVLLRADLTGAVLTDAGGLQEDKDLLRKVCESALQPKHLEMSSVHQCETTHCLAGWAIHHAGPAGYALERMCNWATAGAILVPRLSAALHASNEEATELCKRVIAELDAEVVSDK